MRGGATGVLLTLAKLGFAFLVLALGYMVLSPLATAHWPLAGRLEPVIAHLTASTPVERPVWAIVVLLFGAACFLAALPKSARAKSRRKPPVVLGEAEPVVHVVSPPASAPIPEPMEVSQPVPAPMEPEAPVEPASLTILPVAADATHSAEVVPVAEAETEAHAPTHEEALAAARRAVAVKGDSTDRSRLADLLKKSGDLAEADGQLDPAMAAYEESIEHRRALVAAEPENGREQRWLWTTLESLAECREDRGHRTRAAALYRESLAAGIRTVALSPGETAYPADLEQTRARLNALEAQLAL